MDSRTMVCEWFSPLEDSPPLILTVSWPDGSEYTGLDDHDEIQQAILDEFKEGYYLEDDVCASDWIYTVVAFGRDVTEFMTDDTEYSHLHVTLA